MSAKVSGLIWEVGPQDRSTRFVLLAIADNAGDDGHAYPGIALLSKKTLFEERHVMRAIQKLEAEGWLTVSRRSRGGRGSEYFIDVRKLESLKYDEMSGDKKSGDILSDSGDIQNRCQVTSGTDSGDIQNIPILKNRQEPSLEPSKESPRRIFPEWLPLDLWNDFKAMRKKIRKPMTPKAEELAIRKLAELAEQGSQPAAVLEQSILRSWQGLFAVENTNGGRSNGRNYQSRGERALDAIAEAAANVTARARARSDGAEAGSGSHSQNPRDLRREHGSLF